MRINCPHCGERDLREFTYYGASVYADRPDGGWSDDWDNYLHMRENPAGETHDLWYHELGCSAWIEVTRNTVTHAISATRLLAARDKAGTKGTKP